MKKQILSFLFILSAALLISTSAFAQPTAPSFFLTSTADPGQTLTYTVGTGNGEFTWNVTTTGTAGLPTLDTDNDNSQTIKWPVGASDNDVYKLTAYYKSTDGCYSEMLEYTVTITKKTIEFTTSSAAQEATACSDLTGSVEGGDYPDNEATHTDKVYQNVTYGGADNLGTVTYTIKSGTKYYDSSLLNPTDAAQTLTATNGDADKILDLITNIAYINTTITDVVFTVEITGGTTTTGVTLAAGTIKTSTITVKAKPTIAF